jgi:hypothetical protein
MPSGSILTQSQNFREMPIAHVDYDDAGFEVVHIKCE